MFRFSTLCIALALVALPATTAWAGGRAYKQLKPAKPSVTLIVVVDRSGSMSGAKIAQMRSAVARMISWLRERDWVAVLAFDSRPRFISPLGKVGNRRAHLAAVKNLTADGGTDFLPALQATLRTLKRAPAGHRRHVLFISDGMSPRLGVMSAVHGLVRAGATLSTVALGAHADQKYLRRMAKAGRGRAHATPATGLAAVCRKELRRLGR